MDGWKDKKYEKNRWMVGWLKIYEKIWMVGWIKKMEKIDGWWMDRKNEKNRWMVGWIDKIYEGGWLDG